MVILQVEARQQLVLNTFALRSRGLDGRSGKFFRPDCVILVIEACVVQADLTCRRLLLVYALGVSFTRDGTQRVLVSRLFFNMLHLLPLVVVQYNRYLILWNHRTVRLLDLSVTVSGPRLLLLSNLRKAFQIKTHLRLH